MSILVDYILTLYPQQEFVNCNVSTRLQQCLISFINKQIPFEKAKSTIHSLNLSIDPLEKLNHILNIDPAPASPISTALIPAMKLTKGFSQHESTDSSGTSFKRSKISESSDNDNLPESESAEESDIEISDSKENSSSHSNRRKSQCWTTSEDERLLAGVHRYGLDNWSSVAHFVGNSRTRSQCSQRWFRGIDPRLSKNLWTREEDNMLISLVSFYGDRSWTKIASKLGNRSDVQCRYHYKQIRKEFQSHAHAAAHFFNNNSARIKNTFQKQKDKQQNHDQKTQLQAPDQQYPIQNQQPQFQFQNQQSLFQNQIQGHSIMSQMNRGQCNQMNCFNNYNNLNGASNCYPINPMQPQINFNQMQTQQSNTRSNINSIPNSFYRNPSFISQQRPQMNMMNWNTNNSVQQPSFPSFSNRCSLENYNNNFTNNSHFNQYQAPIVGMNGNTGINPACLQPMQSMPNTTKEYHHKSGSIGRPKKHTKEPTEQIHGSHSQPLSNNQEEEQQARSDTESSQFSSSISSDSLPKQSSNSSSSNEPAIFELDDSDLFSKEALSLFSMSSEKDFLFF